MHERQAGNPKYPGAPIDIGAVPQRYKDRDAFATRCTTTALLGLDARRVCHRAGLAFGLISLSLSARS